MGKKFQNPAHLTKNHDHQLTVEKKRTGGDVKSVPAAYNEQH